MSDLVTTSTLPIYSHSDIFCLLLRKIHLYFYYEYNLREIFPYFKNLSIQLLHLENMFDFELVCYSWKTPLQKL